MTSGTDLIEDVRRSLIAKLADNAAQLTAATLAVETCQRRQNELVEQLRQLPAPKLAHLEHL